MNDSWSVFSRSRAPNDNPSGGIKRTGDQMDSVMLQAVRRTGGTPIVAGVARHLLIPEDDDYETVACWWIADKFDSWEDCSWTVEDLCSYVGLESQKNLLDAELRILQRVNYAIPLNTPVSNLCDMLGSAEYDKWIFAVLESKMFPMLIPSDWCHVILDVQRGKVSSILQLMSFYIDAKILKRLNLNTPRLHHSHNPLKRKLCIMC